MRMAKPDNPPFGQKQRDLNTRIAHEYEWSRRAGDPGLADDHDSPATKAEAAAKAAAEASALHAASMRARRVRPEVVEALIAVRGHNNPADHPYAVASSSLSKVNTWLKEHGKKPVLVDALARNIPHT
jgi:hypothetical protein